MRVPGIISYKKTLKPGIFNGVFSHMDFFPLSKYFYAFEIFSAKYLSFCMTTKLRNMLLAHKTPN